MGIEPGRYVNSAGYVMVKKRDHPNSNCRGYIREHRLIASWAMGAPVPPDAVVHHINGDKTDNRRCNLVVCEDLAYHNLLHYRAQALRECGNADWQRCRYCGEWADPEEEDFYRNDSTQWHRRCHAAYQRQRVSKKAASG